MIQLFVFIVILLVSFVALNPSQVQQRQPPSPTENTKNERTQKKNFFDVIYAQLSLLLLLLLLVVLFLSFVLSFLFSFFFCAIERIYYPSETAAQIALYLLTWPCVVLPFLPWDWMGAPCLHFRLVLSPPYIFMELWVISLHMILED